MAKRPELKMTMPSPEIRSREDIDTMDAMLSLQYGGNHIRTILQNMVKKRRGNGTRRFYINPWPDSEAYGDLGLDEYSNPYIIFGESATYYPMVETVVKGKKKKVRSSVPVIRAESAGFFRFDHDGLFVQTNSANKLSGNWAIRSFLNSIINDYTFYDGGTYGMFTYQGNKKTSANLHVPFGGAITKIEDTLCEDPKCVECQTILPLIPVLKQFNNNLKKNKIPVSGTPQRIQNFDKGYKLEYNNPGNIAYIVEVNMKRIKMANAK